MASAKEMVDQVFSVVKDLTPIQKMIGGLVFAVVLTGIIMLSTKESSTSYAVMYSSLSEDDASDVVAKLKELRIPYELDMNGTAVKVPADKVLETRLSLAGEGLPRGGGVGFEIFDRNSLGTTDFVQKLNYQRALQGELARTIRQFQQIQEARVHIAKPKDSVFIEDQRPPSASVSLKMRGGNQLSQKQVQAIVNLVGSAVQGLTEDNITIVDTAGRLLFRKRGDDPSMLSATQLEYQLNIERDMRNKLETMFEEIVGVGKAIARVSVELDTDQVDTTEELFDPEAQVVRSEQLLNEENKEGGQEPAGIPGVKGNLATFNEGQDGSGGGVSNTRNNVTRNYEISKTIKHVKTRSGAIKRLSVAVMVDGTYDKEVDKDGNAQIKYIPRTDEDLKSFATMAQNAVGFDSERGDKLEVVGLSFATSMALEPKADVMAKYQEVLDRMAQPIIYLLISVCFIFFVVRPFFRLLSSKQLEEQRRAMLAKVDEEETQLTEEELALKPLGMTDKERIYKLAQSDPDRAADLVKRWLREDKR